jgi:uncharacterized protein (DUF1330 family)
MTKGYWIAQVDVADAEGYKSYIAANGVAFATYGARFLVRGAVPEVPEGTARARVVVIEFPSLQAATDCYHSPEYARAKALRLAHAQADVILIEGYDGPQPGAN